MPSPNSLRCSVLEQFPTSTLSLHFSNPVPEIPHRPAHFPCASGVEIDEVTIVTVLNGSTMPESICLGRCIHDFYLLAGRVKRDVPVGFALIKMYAKCGCCDDASKVFDEMPFRNVVSWSSLISGYLLRNRFGDALSISFDMLADGPKANQVMLPAFSCPVLNWEH